MEETDLNRTADASGEPSDAHLMLAVAERRDVKAFEQLYRRYERPAYNLSLYLSGSSTAAEEALQEAALRVWRLAKNFRPDGSFKGWFFTIVADCCVKQRRGGLREKARAERHAERHPSGGTIEPGTDMENRELKRALNEQMACLEPQDRRLLALYYGADLSQQEIGRVLDVPQTTVSLKLREALGKLRAGLTTAGFAAAVPLLEAGQLGEVLLGGVQVPPGLHGKVLQGLTSAAMRSARVSGAAKQGSLLNLPIAAAAAAAAAVAAAGALGWWAVGKKPEAQPVANAEQVEPASHASSTPGPAPAGTARLRNLTWTFENGMPDGFVPMEPKWKIREHPVTKVRLLTIEAFSQGTFSLLALPVRVGRAPFVVTLEEIPMKDGYRSHSFAFSDGRNLYQGGGWDTLVHQASDSEMLSTHMEYTCWFTGRHMILTQRGKVVMLMEFDAGMPSGLRLMLAGNGMAIKSLAFREITDTELPESLHDIDALIKIFEDQGIKYEKPATTPLLKQDIDLLATIKDAEE